MKALRLALVLFTLTFSGLLAANDEVGNISNDENNLSNSNVGGNIIAEQGAQSSSANNAFNTTNYDLGGDPYTDTIGLRSVSCTRSALTVSGHQNYNDRTQRSNGGLMLSYTMPLGNSKCEQAENAMYKQLARQQTHQERLADRREEALLEEKKFAAFKVAAYIANVCKQFHHAVIADKKSPLYKECLAYEPLHASPGRPHLKRVAGHSHNGE